MTMKTMLSVFLLPLIVSGDKSWSLFHSFDSGKTFTERGTLSLRLTEEGQVEAKVEHSSNAGLELDRVNALAAKNFYQLKLTTSNGEEVITSVPACQVRRANFRDEVAVVLNSKAEPVSLSYTPLVSPLAAPCSELANLEELPSFTTKVTIEAAIPGMTVPPVLPQTKPQPGLKFFPRSKDAIPGANPQEAGTTQSFLMKYWYILLPLFIMGVFGGAEPQPQQQEQQGSQQQGSAGARAPAPAAAAAPPAAGAGKARRGKRS